MRAAQGLDISVADGSCPKAVSEESQQRGLIDLVIPTESWTPKVQELREKALIVHFKGTW